MLTLQQLKPFKINNQSTVDSINRTLVRYAINSPLRINHFLAQIFHESGNLRTLKENLNYSTVRLTQIFKKYFPTVMTTYGYANNPQKIANKVYANRMGNGPESSNDGFKYKGRGAIQLTGKDNYQQLSDDLGIDFINKPELLETIEYALLSAGWYWDKNNLNALADADNLLGITKLINGGTHGLAQRKANLISLTSIIK